MKKLYNKYKIIYIYFAGDQIKKNERGGACGTVWGDKRVAYTVLVRNPQGKRPLARPRRR